MKRQLAETSVLTRQKVTKFEQCGVAMINKPSHNHGRMDLDVVRACYNIQRAGMNMTLPNLSVTPPVHACSTHYNSTCFLSLERAAGQSLKFTITAINEKAFANIFRFAMAYILKYKKDMIFIAEQVH